MTSTTDTNRRGCEMAAWGDFHQVSGAGWSVFWRIPMMDGSGLEVWWGDFHGRRVIWLGTQPFAIVPYHNPMTGEPVPPEFTCNDGINPHRHGSPFLPPIHGPSNRREPRT